MIVHTVSGQLSATNQNISVPFQSLNLRTFVGSKPAQKIGTKIRHMRSTLPKSTHKVLWV